jgi:hypothetical protein
MKASGDHKAEKSVALGEITAEAWREFSVGAGIADLDLGGETIVPQEVSSYVRAL